MAAPAEGIQAPWLRPVRSTVMDKDPQTTDEETRIAEGTHRHN